MSHAYRNAAAFKRAIEPVYGRLTVIDHDGKGGIYCACSCGSAPRLFSLKSVQDGNTRSCGCLGRERRAEGCRLKNTKHGQAHTQIYQVWCELRRRCSEPSSPSYANYGGRGIKVCARWAFSFEDFASDMGPRPHGTSVERRDNNGDYSPENCYWATREEQARNKRNNVFLEFDGRRMTVIEWALAKGMNRSTLYSRIDKLGWSAERALTTPLKSAGWRSNPVKP